MTNTNNNKGNEKKSGSYVDDVENMFNEMRKIKGLPEKKEKNKQSGKNLKNLPDETSKNSAEKNEKKMPYITPPDIKEPTPTRPSGKKGEELEKILQVGIVAKPQTRQTTPAPEIPVTNTKKSTNQYANNKKGGFFKKLFTTAAILTIIGGIYYFNRMPSKPDFTPAIVNPQPNQQSTTPTTQKKKTPENKPQERVQKQEKKPVVAKTLQTDKEIAKLNTDSRPYANIKIPVPDLEYDDLNPKLDEKINSSPEITNYRKNIENKINNSYGQKQNFNFDLPKNPSPESELISMIEDDAQQFVDDLTSMIAMFQEDGKMTNDEKKELKRFYDENIIDLKNNAKHSKKLGMIYETAVLKYRLANMGG